MQGSDENVRSDGGKGRHSPFLIRIERVRSVIDWSGRIIAALCLSFLFVVLLVNVILRYGFDSGIAWAYEIHALLLPWLVAGGLVIASSKGQHIVITLLPELIGRRARQILMLAVEGLVLLISISVLMSSRPILMAAQYQTYSTLPLSQVWGYYSLVYAFAGMAAIAVLDILRLLAGVDVFDPDPAHASLS